MKINFPIEELVDYLQLINQVVPSRTTRPILSCTLIEVQDKQVSLTSTDLEVSVRCFLSEARGVKGNGKVVISANRLSAICQEVKEGVLEMEVSGNQIQVSALGSVFKLPTEDPDDFPELNFKSKSCGDIETEELASMIKKTSFATAAERSRFAINGIHVQVKDKKLSLTATDGRRLANMKTEIKGSVSEFTVIIPARALIILQKVISSSQKMKIEIEIDDNQVIFHLPGVSILARLISGKFPDYESVIPKSNKNILTIDKSNFERIIRSAALVTSDDSRSILLNFSEGKVSASAKTQLFGESNVQDDVEYDGGEVEIRFNPTYLLEGLRVCETKKVKLRLKDNSSAGLLEEKGGSNYRYVVTPINLVS